MAMSSRHAQSTTPAWAAYDAVPIAADGASSSSAGRPSPSAPRADAAAAAAAAAATAGVDADLSSDSGLPGHCTLPEHMAQDLFFGALGGAMWAAAAIKTAHHVTLAINLTNLLGFLALVGVSLLWPALRPASYRRWRVRALACLRLSLVCLPVNFSTAAQDTIAPRLNTGRLSWLTNISHILMGTHLSVLLFTGAGWRLPLRVHMTVQALMVAVLARYAMQVHLRSQLLACPRMEALVLCYHRFMAVFAEAVMPGASRITLGLNLEAQKAALLLFWWLAIGWLLPTLMVMWPDTHAGQAAPGGHRAPHRAPAAWAHPAGRLFQAAAGWAADQVEGVLHSLLCAAPPPLEDRRHGQQQEQQEQWLEQHRRQGQQQSGAVATGPWMQPLVLRWLGLLLLLWLACCSVAPRFTTSAAA